MKTNSLIAFASVLALGAGLAACGDKTAQPGEEKAAAAGEAGAESSNLSFDASGMPLFKAGLWESRGVGFGGEDDEVNRTCVGPELDAETREQIFGESEGCTKTVDRARGGLRVTGVCEQADVRTDMTLTMVGTQTQRTFNMEMKVDNLRDPDPAVTHKMTVVGKYVGPCPAGMQPGDEMDNGE